MARIKNAGRISRQAIDRPKRRLGVDFIHEVVSLPATTLSDDDQKADDHQKAIAKLILTGDIGSLLRAFQLMLGRHRA